MFDICSNYSNKYICEGAAQEFFHKDTNEAIKLLHVNCRSIDNSLIAFENLLSACNYITALAVTETWLTAATKDIHQIPGCVLISSPRLNKSGGGVEIYLNELLDYVKRTDISVMTPYLECLFIEIKQSNKRSILIGSVYRPPSADVVLFNKQLLEIVKIIPAESAKLTFMLVDYNLDLLKYRSNSSVGEFFLDNMVSHYFFATIQIQPE